MTSAIFPLNNAVLNEIAKYQHRGVTSRIMKILNISHSEAQELFDDTKRFLFLAAITGKDISPTKPIDEAWHIFLLFTKDYSEFCFRFFGQMIHHHPFDESELKEDKTDNIGVTLQLARSLFGSSLSKNWEYLEASDCGCGGCSGDAPPVCCPEITKTGLSQILLISN